MPSVAPTPSQASNPNGISTEPINPPFREGGYGWVVVTAVAMVNAHSWGLNTSYAIFLAYYLHSDYFPGATALDFAFVGGLSVSIALLVSPLVTQCVAKLGTNNTLRIGVFFETLSLVGASFASTIWQLILSQGVCFGVGLGFCFHSTVGIVSQWFTTRRSFANALATSGSGFGGLCYSIATHAMITQLGLPWAFRILAIIACVVLGTCSLVMRTRNKAVGARLIAFHTSLLSRPEFWLFVGWGFFTIMSYTVVLFSLADYAVQVGFSASQGSIVAAILNLSQGIGRPLIGLVSDRLGRINVAGLSTLIASLSAFLLWTLAGQYYAGLLVYALFGMFAGVLWPTVAPVGAEIVGLPLLPAALSMYWVGLVLPSTFAEVIGLALRKPGPQGYRNVQLLTGALYMVAFLFIWMLRSWKLGTLMDAGQPREAERRNADADAVPPTTTATTAMKSTTTSAWCSPESRRKKVVLYLTLVLSRKRI